MSKPKHSTYFINPVPKPRMTRSDKWKKRPVVLRFFEFRDQVKRVGIEVPEAGATVIFRVPMPPSWSKKKREAMDGQAHQQKPDVDNYLKAVLDSVYEEDSGVWDVRPVKLWAKEGSITVIKGEPYGTRDNKVHRLQGGKDNDSGVVQEGEQKL